MRCGVQLGRGTLCFLPQSGAAASMCSFCFGGSHEFMAARSQGLGTLLGVLPALTSITHWQTAVAVSLSLSLSLSVSLCLSWLLLPGWYCQLIGPAFGEDPLRLPAAKLRQADCYGSC